MAHRVVWWRLVGAVPVCPPVSPCKGASVVHPRAQCVYFWYGNAATRTFGRAHRHRPYGFVWADCTWPVDAVLGITHGWLISFGMNYAWGGWFRLGRLHADGWHCSCAILPVCLCAFSFYAFYFCSVYFFNG